MKKIDDTIKRETGYIAAWVIILSAVMQSVFLIIGKWDYTVLLGNLLSALAAVGNFFMMGVTLQNALQKEEKDAKNTMKASQSLRTLALFIVCVIGVVLPYFSIWTVLIPLLFPRVAIAFRPLFEKRE